MIKILCNIILVLLFICAVASIGLGMFGAITLSGHHAFVGAISFLSNMVCVGLIITLRDINDI